MEPGVTTLMNRQRTSRPIDASDRRLAAERCRRRRRRRIKSTGVDGRGAVDCKTRNRETVRQYQRFGTSVVAAPDDIWRRNG